jgi:Glycosyltransferases involved in cell wall biogenesis
MDYKTMVSICCITYNHEKFISEAVKSFLMQKTDFSYEIIINDDASTDNTSLILSGLESKYPEIIRVIYHKENQFSKSVHAVVQNCFERARGKYVALCEGDDYWTDPLKLQKQVEYMEKHPECSLCVHAARFVSSRNFRQASYSRPNQGDKIFTAKEVIEGGGSLFATSSVLYPAGYNRDLPNFYNEAPVGDYPLVIYLALRGTVYYMDAFMSVYRINTPESWTNSNKSYDKQKKLYSEIARMLDEVNRYSDYEYDQTIEKTKLRDYFNLLITLGLYRDAKKEEMYCSLHLKEKLKILIKQYLPITAAAVILIKSKILR